MQLSCHLADVLCITILTFDILNDPTFLLSSDLIFGLPRHYCKQVMYRRIPTKKCTAPEDTMKPRIYIWRANVPMKDYSPEESWESILDDNWMEILICTAWPMPWSLDLMVGKTITVCSCSSLNAKAYWLEKDLWTKTRRSCLANE